MGRAKDAALGIRHYMRVGNSFSMPSDAGGVQKIVAEIEYSGHDEDRENLHYILYETAGSSPKVFDNGGLKRDCDQHGHVLPGRIRSDGSGKTFSDFVREAQLRTAAEAGLPETSPLHEAQVLGLRLYTTSTYKRLNGPLRDQSRNAPPHQLPVTMLYIEDGISKLRAAAEADGNHATDLYRGMRNVTAPRDFMRDGGTELAPMSTTTNLRVAVEYAKSPSSLIFKIATKSFLERGANLAFVSAFPGEDEFLLPPLTVAQ